MSKPDGKARFKKNLIFLSLTINAIIAIILFTPLTEALYKPLIVDDTPLKSEAIVILASSVYQDGFPGFRTIARLMKGLDLFRQGYAPKIICIGGKYSGINSSTAVSMKKTLILYGINKENILVQDNTLNTYYDLSAVLEKFKNDFNFNRVIFVTSSYHTYRVKKVLEKKGIQPLIVSANKYELNPQLWAERWGLFREVAREYIAIVYFKLRGWI